MGGAYTHGHDESVLRSHRWRTAANSAAYLIPHLAAGQDLLDVGCGPGTITVELAGLVAPGHVTGIDPSAEVVAQARGLAGDVGLDVTFRVGDVHDLDVPDASFDVVHAHQVLQHVSDPVGALREMRRVCRPGSLVAARDADYAAMTWHPQIPELDRWLALYRELARRNGGEPDAGRRLRSWALAAGFADLEASASAWCFADEADRTWWAGTWAERVTRSAIARQALAEQLADPAELEHLAEGWHRWAATPDAWFAVLHGEILCRA